MLNHLNIIPDNWDEPLFDIEFEDEEQAERDEQLRQEALEDRFQAEREGE